MDLTTKTAALIIGIIFIVVGLLGFVPNPLVSPTGLFAVNTAHNLIHLLTGVVIIAGAYSAFGARNTLLIFGAVYAVVAIAGFIPALMTGGNMLLGFVHVNDADKWLHVLLAIVILAAGYYLPNERTATA
jgi:uncharacterized protein DUF4383